VYVSSIAASGSSPDGRPLHEEMVERPVSAYGRSKLRGERALRALSAELPVTILRPPAIFGPRDPNLLLEFKLAKRGLLLNMGLSRDSVMDFAYVGNVVRAAVLAGAMDTASGEVYFVGEGVARTWDEILDMTADVLGVRAIRIRVPPLGTRLIGELGTFWAQVTGRAVILDRGKAQELLQRCWSIDISKAARDLGYKPVADLRQGLEATVDGYRALGLL